MSFTDLMRLAGGSIFAHRLRSALTMLGILIGIASVILLTSIGEGTHDYVLKQFTQFGTTVMAINPGKTQTTGSPGALGGTVKKLTIEDAEALERLPGVEDVVPLSFGLARVELEERGRSVFIYGVNSKVPKVWKFGVRQGRFLPERDPRRPAPLVVLGPTLKRELFEEDNALGRHVRIGGQRFLVIGVMEPKGQLLGIDIDDSAYIPVANALQIFNKDGLMEIDILFSSLAAESEIVERVRELMIERHDGEEDFTITTQTAMLDVMGNVLGIVSIAVAAIAGISLFVGALGILTMMWISVNERVNEIGLAKAIGATSGQVLSLFLGEAILLSLAGGLLGVGAGLGIAWLIKAFLPGLPVVVPWRFVFAAVATSFAVGVLSGALPAKRAAALDPVEALRAE
jgi:putative ABC transport system permease protein